MAKNPDTKSIYEIFRSCRLCGSVGGYKMPIIQSVIGIDFNDIDLRQKIRECVQIEVQEDDKMPPLVCEMCIDKINDYHDFLSMCQETNNRTRIRLGHPASHITHTNSSEDCILGVTEPVFVTNVLEQPVAKKPKPMGPKSKREEREKLEKQRLEEEALAKVREEERLKAKAKKKEKRKLNKELLTLQTEVTKLDLNSSRDSRQTKIPEPSPTRSTRKKPSAEKVIDETPPRKGIKITISKPKVKQDFEMKKDFESEDDELLVPRVKRTRDKNQIKLEIPSKKVKITMNIPQKPASPAISETPKSVKEISKDKTVKGSPKTVKEPPKITKEPAVTSKETKTPIKTAKEPVKTAKEPVKTAKEPVKTAKEPVKTAKEPVKTAKDPVKTAKEPVKKEMKPSEARFTCAICESPMKSVQALIGHLKVHTIKYTDPSLACNACGEWFVSPEEMNAHHKKHSKTPYRCQYCKVKCKRLQTFDNHYVTCLESHFSPTPDVQCQKCQKSYTTDTLLSQHKCQPQAKLTKCTKCDMTMYKNNLSRHMKKMHGGKKEVITPQVKIPPNLKRRLKPAQVRIVRCDTLLKKIVKRNSFDVSNVKPKFGLDRKCVYPYLEVKKTVRKSKPKVKSEPFTFDGMVSIQLPSEMTYQVYREEDYVHWDSDVSSDSDYEEIVNENNKKYKKVQSLIKLSIKTIYSKRCLGKVPRKVRKVKQDKLFESLFNCEDNNDGLNLNQILSNLNDDIDDTNGIRNEDNDAQINDHDGQNNDKDAKCTENGSQNKYNYGQNDDNTDQNQDNDNENKISELINETNQFNDEAEDSDSLLDKSIITPNIFRPYDDDINDRKVDQVNDNDKNNDTQGIVTNINESGTDVTNDSEMNRPFDDIIKDTKVDHVNDDDKDNDSKNTINNVIENINNDTSQNFTTDNVTQDTNMNESGTDASNGDEINEEKVIETVSNGIEKSNEIENNVNDNEIGINNGENEKVEYNNDKVDYNNDKSEKYDFSDNSDKLMAALDEQIGDSVSDYTKKDYTADDFEF